MKNDVEAVRIMTPPEWTDGETRIAHSHISRYVDVLSLLTEQAGPVINRNLSTEQAAWCVMAAHLMVAALYSRILEMDTAKFGEIAVGMHADDRLGDETVN